MSISFRTKRIAEHSLPARVLVVTRSWTPVRSFVLAKLRPHVMRGLPDAEVGAVVESDMVDKIMKCRELTPSHQAPDPLDCSSR